MAEFFTHAPYTDASHSNFNTVGGNQYNTYVNQSLEEENILATLKPAGRGGYVPQCMEGTRMDILKKVDGWLDNVDVPNILWISGSPGAGKSAIASTLISKLAKQRRLGSSFFFKRGHASLGDPTTLWRTVASDLARFHPDVKLSLIEFLNTGGSRHDDIGLHFECMIEEPLRKNNEKLSINPPVVVLDALDECGSDISQSAQRHILLDTLTRWSQLPRLFKLVVTSRGERVPRSFYDVSVCHHIVLETGDSVSTETTNDVRVFFEKSFAKIVELYPSLSPTWPEKAVIDQLTTRAAGLFIWAKTAMAFMEEEEGIPNTQLKLILNGELGYGRNNIDTLYQQILDVSFKDCKDAMLEAFRAVVGAIVVSKMPLHRDDLKFFLGRGGYDDETKWDSVLQKLSSVISKGELDGLLRIRHLSFAEFLGDAGRCRECFIIDRSAQSQSLALACLQLMNGALKFNICNLGTSYLRNDSVEDLPSRIRKAIPTRLSYPCRFWAAHLRDSTGERRYNDELLNEISNFLRFHLLYWLEVLSLIKEVPVASPALIVVARWAAVSFM